MSDNLTKPDQHIVLSDEMCERAWDAYCEARDQGDDEPKVVMRAALEAAFKDVPLTNYGIGLALQFFDMVICVKDREMGAAAGVYVKNDDPDGFDALGHGIDVNYGFIGDGPMPERTRFIKSIRISGMDANA